MSEVKWTYRRSEWDSHQNPVSNWPQSGEVLRIDNSCGRDHLQDQNYQGYSNSLNLHSFIVSSGYNALIEMIS